MTTSAIGKLADVDLDVKPMRMVDTTFNLNPTKDYGLSSDLADYGERTIVPWLQKTYQSDSIAGQALRGLGWIGEQHSKIPGYDLAERTLGQAGGKIAGAVGVDPRIGMLVGSVLMPDITDVIPGIGGALGTASKTARKVAGESAGRTGRILNDLQRGVAHSYNPVLHDMPSYGYQRGLGVSGLGDDVSLAARSDELIQNQERILSGLYNKKQLKKIREHPKGNELIELILSHQDRLSRVETKTYSGGYTAQAWPGSEHELITSVRKLIKLKEEIELPNVRTRYAQELGAFIMDDEPARITGGLNTQNTPAKFQSRKGLVNRTFRELLWPVDERFKAGRKKDLKARHADETWEKHHMRILASSEPLAMRYDPIKGEYIPRDKGQLERVAKKLQEDGIYIGDQDLNEVFLTVGAHRGKKGWKYNKYAAHNILRNNTDLQGALLSEAEFVEVLLKGETEWQWVKQISKDGETGLDLKDNVFETREGTIIKNDAIQKDGKTLMKRRFRNRVSKDVKELKAREARGQQIYRTYDVRQRHGWSEEAVRDIANITDENQLYEVIKGYYELTDEAFLGASGIAAAITQSGLKLDKASLTALQASYPNTVEFAKALLKTPQFKGDKYLQNIINKYKKIAEPIQRDVRGKNY